MTGRENKGRRPARGGGNLRPSAPKVPTPERTVEAQGDVAILVHELANLLDGSMRWLTLALKSIDRARGQHADESLDNAHRQMESAATALERMADLVANSMQGASLSIGSAILSGGPPVTLAECVQHAAEVLGPEAQELGVAVTIDIAEDLRLLPAGPLYSAVLNGLRNGLDSIRSCGAARAGAPGVPGGTIQVGAVRGSDRRADPAAEPWVVLTITDDGKGPPPLTGNHSVFDHGFTTKEGGSGLGLAVARSVVREMNGTIELNSRSDARDFRRPGAVLRIAFPPAPPTDLGGAE